LAPFADGIEIDHTEKQTSWKTSGRYMITTKVDLHRCYAKIREGFQMPDLARLPTLESERRDVDDLENVDFHALRILPDNDNDCAYLCAWLEPHEFDQVSASIGKDKLQDWLDTKDVASAVERAMSDSNGWVEPKVTRRSQL